MAANRWRQEGQLALVTGASAGIGLAITRELLGDDHVATPGFTVMGSEDFAFYAQRIPGVYAFIGNGDTPMVHHPKYVFDPSNLAVGAAYWVALAQSHLRE